ncbi:MAG: hypothetical protein MI741_23745, partial [Rhodospirillales bacterium]|nr:hypothetical protein [Rhodospirillales bacterium]
LRQLISALRNSNRFYTTRLDKAGITDAPRSLTEFTARYPFTTKQQLAEDQQATPPYGTNLTFPLEAYTRFHQTSGTTGKPLRWLDTTESWQGLLDNWRLVFDAAGVTSSDCVFFHFPSARSLASGPRLNLRHSSARCASPAGA